MKGSHYRGEELPSMPGEAALTFTRGGGGGGRAANVVRASLEGVVRLRPRGSDEWRFGVRGIRSGC